MNTRNGEGPMACDAVAGALLPAADGELSEAEWLEMKRHLDQCAACRTKWESFALTDGRLLECAAELDALCPSDSALRVRLVNALHGRTTRRWSWMPGPANWKWASVFLAALGLAAAAIWTVTVTPLHVEHRRAAADAPPASGEVVRMQLSLAPAGDPFLDGSPSESLVLADVAVGPDGEPTGMRLAE